MAVLSKYSSKEFIRGLLVHELSAGNTSNLDAGIIPNSLKLALSGIVTVEPSATISTIRQNNKWVIQNGEKKLIVHKDKDRPAVLRIYKEDFTEELDLVPGSEIVGTAFYCQSLLAEAGDPYKHIFPESMTGVTFRRCNLDNVYIPPNNTVDSDCCHRRIKIQNDLMNWIVDENGDPVEPFNKADYIRLGVSIDPADIPTKPLERPILHTVEDAAELVARLAVGD